MKTPRSVAALAADLNCTACPQDTYTSGVSLRLYSLREQNGTTKIARVASKWVEKHVYEVDQLRQVEKRLGQPVYFLIGDSKNCEFVVLDEALPAMRRFHRSQRELLAERLREIDWLISEIDSLAERG